MTSLRVVKMPKVDLPAMDLDMEAVFLVDEVLHRIKVGQGRTMNQTILMDLEETLKAFVKRNQLDWDPHEHARLPKEHPQAGRELSDNMLVYVDPWESRR